MNSAAESPFLRPHRSRRRSLGVGPMPQLVVRGIEVVQSIQRMDNSIPLIANKPAVVRVYVSPTSAPTSVPVAAEITWQREGGESYLPVPGSLRLDPATPRSLEEQRRDPALSINVRLPPEAVVAGEARLRVSRLRLVGGEDFALSGTTTITVSFVTSPPLRIRAVGLRYREGSRTVTPEARHFNYLRSYLSRAYPTATLQWSQIVVDADFSRHLRSGHHCWQTRSSPLCAVERCPMG